jgi:superfamily II DNA or RNA helicase
MDSIKLIIKSANLYLENPDVALIQHLIKDFSYELKDAYWIKRALLKRGIKGYQALIHFYNIKHNSLPIGFYNSLIKNLTQKGYEITVDDQRQELREYIMPERLIGKELRQYQIDAVNYVMNNKITFLQLPTSSGKTLIAGEVIRRNKGLTLFIVDRNILLTQTMNEFERLFQCKIGNITEGEMNIKLINVATIQTLNSLLKQKNKELINYLANVKTYILDESHVAASSSYMRVSKYVVNADIRLGLSASYEREDGRQMDIESCVGKPEFIINVNDLIEQDYIMKPEIMFFHYSHELVDCYNYHDAYNKRIVNAIYRNILILNLVNKFKNYNILIIISKIEHGKYLNSKIQNSVFIHGNVEQTEREKWLDDMKLNRGKIIIGTASIIGKGLDIPSLDVMINATGNLSAITTIQSLGRVLRKHEGKNKAYYIDFMDIGDYFKEHTNKRMEVLKQQGYEIKTLVKKNDDSV